MWPSCSTAILGVCRLHPAAGHQLCVSLPGRPWLLAGPCLSSPCIPQDTQPPQGSTSSHLFTHLFSGGVWRAPHPPRKEKVPMNCLPLHQAHFLSREEGAVGIFSSRHLFSHFVL